MYLQKSVLSCNTDLLDSNADSQWIHWSFNENFLFLISADDHWCKQQFLACTTAHTHCTQHVNAITSSSL